MKAAMYVWQGNGRLPTGWVRNKLGGGWMLESEKYAGLISEKGWNEEWVYIRGERVL